MEIFVPSINHQEFVEYNRNLKQKEMNDNANLSVSCGGVIGIDTDYKYDRMPRSIDSELDIINLNAEEKTNYEPISMMNMNHSAGVSSMIETRANFEGLDGFYYQGRENTTLTVAENEVELNVLSLQQNQNQNRYLNYSTEIDGDNIQNEMNFMQNNTHPNIINNQMYLHNKPVPYNTFLCDEDGNVHDPEYNDVTPIRNLPPRHRTTSINYSQPKPNITHRDFVGKYTDISRNMGRNDYGVSNIGIASIPPYSNFPSNIDGIFSSSSDGKDNNNFKRSRDEDSKF
jgi:hypothetical protein